MPHQTVSPHRSLLGIDANLVILVGYFGHLLVNQVDFLARLQWLVPVAIFVLEKRSRFVRFHAMQSFTLHLVGLAYALIMGGFFARLVVMPPTEWGALGGLAILGIVLALVLLAASVVAAINGMQYKMYHLPLIGGLAARLTATLEGLIHRDG